MTGSPTTEPQPPPVWVTDADLAAAEARGYQNAIDLLLAIPSHESHVCAELLEVRRDGGQTEIATALECDETRGEARGREQGRREMIDKLRAEARLLPEGGVVRQEPGIYYDGWVHSVGWSASPATHVRIRITWPVEGQSNDDWPVYAGPWIPAADFLESTGGPEVPEVDGIPLVEPGGRCAVCGAFACFDAPEGADDVCHAWHELAEAIRHYRASGGPEPRDPDEIRPPGGSTGGQL